MNGIFKQFEKVVGLFFVGRSISLRVHGRNRHMRHVAERWQFQTVGGFLESTSSLFLAHIAPYNPGIQWLLPGDASLEWLRLHWCLRTSDLLLQGIELSQQSRSCLHSDGIQSPFRVQGGSPTRHAARCRRRLQWHYLHTILASQQGSWIVGVHTLPWQGDLLALYPPKKRPLHCLVSHNEYVLCRTCASDGQITIML